MASPKTVVKDMRENMIRYLGKEHSRKIARTTSILRQEHALWVRGTVRKSLEQMA